MEENSALPAWCEPFKALLKELFAEIDAEAEHEGEDE